MALPISSNSTKREAKEVLYNDVLDLCEKERCLMTREGFYYLKTGEKLTDQWPRIQTALYLTQKKAQSIFNIHVVVKAFKSIPSMFLQSPWKRDIALLKKGYEKETKTKIADIDFIAAMLLRGHSIRINKIDLPNAQIGKIFLDARFSIR